MFKFKYALFVEGFGIQENLDILFNTINNEFETLKKKNINLKLVYRPHPWRKNQKKINVKKFRNIVLDPQLKNFYNKGISNNSVQPNLKYYPSLIKNAKFIIAAPSTMVIESTIFWKKIILLAHDKYLPFGNYSYLKNIEHFDGIVNFPNIKVCYNIDDLKHNIQFCLKSKKIDKARIDKLRNFYLHNNKLNYPKKLKNLINNIYN